MASHRRSFGLSQSFCGRCSFDAGLALVCTSGNHRKKGMTARKVRFSHLFNMDWQKLPAEWLWVTHDFLGCQGCHCQIHHLQKTPLIPRRFGSFCGGQPWHHFLLILLLVPRKLCILFNLSPIVGDNSLMQWCSTVARQKHQAIRALRCAGHTTVYFLLCSGTRILISSRVPPFWNDLIDRSKNSKAVQSYFEARRPSHW